MKYTLEDLKANKNNIKNIYFDLDGTLLNNKKQVDFSTKNLINELVKNNINVGIATGRSHLSAEYIAHDLGLNLPIVAGNGAIYSHNNSWNLDKIILPNNALTIINFLNDKKLGFSIYTSSNIYDVNRQYDADVKEYHKKITPDYFEQIKNESIYKFFVHLGVKIFDHKDAYNEIQDQILSIGDLEIVSSEKNFIDIMPTNVSKGNTIKHILENRGLSTEQTLVFGDNNNDVSMFKILKYSIAMNNGSIAAKEHAKLISLASNNEHGVEQMLKLIFGL